MVVIAHVRAEPLDVSRCVGLDLAVTQEGKAVAVAVSDVVVFQPGLLNRLEEMDCLFFEVKGVSVV